jgi:predicted dinucleotide-binding enzyme
MTTIAILGAGNIGKTIGRKWARAGHQLAFGVQNTSTERAEALQADLDLPASTIVGTPSDALMNAEVVLLAVPGEVAAQVVTDHAVLLDGKIIIDATNYIEDMARVMATQKLEQAVPFNALAALWQAAPNARIYRAFNIYGWEVFDNADFGGESPHLIYAGTEGPERTLVEQLVREVGLEPLYAGGFERFSLVDNILPLFFNLAVLQGLGRNLGIRVLTRQP